MANTMMVSSGVSSHHCCKSIRTKPRPPAPQPSSGAKGTFRQACQSTRDTSPVTELPSLESRSPWQNRKCLRWAQVYSRKNIPYCPGSWCNLSVEEGLVPECSHLPPPLRATAMCQADEVVRGAHHLGSVTVWLSAPRQTSPALLESVSSFIT